MKQRNVTVSLKDGLDTREIALCVQKASSFRSSIHLTDGMKRMNAKSIMGMMAMGLALGDDVTIQADGEDEDAAIEALADYFEGR